MRDGGEVIQGRIQRRTQQLQSQSETGRCLFGLILLELYK